MGIMSRVRDYLGGGSVNELGTIFDHERISFEPEEFDRIAHSFRVYSGKYDDIAYLNSYSKIKHRPYIHLNMLNKIAKYMGTLLFNEKCSISIDENAGADVDFITHVLEHNDFIKNFARYVQPMLATGGLAVKPYYDPTTGEIEFSWCLSDVFVPLYSNSNSISEAAIVSHTKKADGDKSLYYTLMEFHEWASEGYRISNELYRSDSQDKVGKRVPLTELYEGLLEESYYYNLSRPLFSYCTPADFNNISPQSPLGLGICDNSMPTLSALNDTYNEFHWEVRMGRRRVVVSDHFLKVKDIDGVPTQYFDDESDVFLALPAGMDNFQFTDVTAPIRASEYAAAIESWLSYLEMEVGISQGTFTFDGKSVRTATEVISEDSVTYKTRSHHLTNVEQFIQELIISVYELARESYNANGDPIYSGEIPTKEQIVIDFDDSVFMSKDAELDWWTRATQAGVAPRIEAVKRVNNLSESDAKEWYDQIYRESTGADPYEQQVASEAELYGEEES